MIRDILYRTFEGRLLISEYHCLMSRIMPLFISDERAVKRYFKKKTGRNLDFNNLSSFADKLNWYKLYHHQPLMQQCADKYAVRKYIMDCGYSYILNEMYGVYDDVDDIKLNDLPDRFVLKAAHGSHMNIIYPDTSYSWSQCRMLMKSWLKQDIYWSGREWVYKNMPKRIIAEKFLEDESGELRDYKLFCYHGKPHYLQFDSGRLRGVHYRNFYDMELNLLDITDNTTHINPSICPIDKASFEKMKHIASDLAKPFEFVRTDFYFVKGKIIFGELTFFDGGGYSGFSKESYDKIFGDPWHIEQVTRK